MGMIPHINIADLKLRWKQNSFKSPASESCEVEYFLPCFFHAKPSLKVPFPPLLLWFTMWKGSVQHILFSRQKNCWEFVLVTASNSWSPINNEVTSHSSKTQNKNTPVLCLTGNTDVTSNHDVYVKIIKYPSSAPQKWYKRTMQSKRQGSLTVYQNCYYHGLSHLS